MPPLPLVRLRCSNSLRIAASARLVRGVTDHYYDKAPGFHAVGRTMDAQLISGDELGDWRDRVLVPHDVPCFVTAEQIA